MKRFTTLLLSALLVCSLSLPTFAAESDDTEPPELEEVYVDTNYMYPGGKIIVSADATDDDSGIDWIEVLFVHENGKTYYEAQLRVNSVDTTLEQYSGPLYLPKDAPQGNYHMTRVVLQDRDGNRSAYYPQERFTGNNDYNRVFTKNVRFSVGSSTTSGMLQQCFVTNNNGVYTFQATASGGVGYIDTITALYENPETNRKLITTVGEDEYIENNTFQKKLDISPYEPSGTFQLKKVILKDAAGHKTTYSADLEEEDALPLTIGSSFTVTSLQTDVTKPVFHSVQFTRTWKDEDNLNVGLEVVATDDISGIDHVTVKFVNHQTDKSLRKVMRPEHHVGNNTYRATLKADLEDDTGTWTLDSVTVVDHAGNSMTYRPNSEIKNDKKLPLPQIISFTCN